jgi:hypothetical protein
MVKKYKVPLIEALLRDRFLFLLISLLSLILLAPLLGEYVNLNTLSDIIITSIFLSAIYAISKKERYFLISLLLLLPVLVAIWLSHFVNTPFLRLVGNCCGILFFAFTIIIILSAIFRENEVTLDVIYGAIAVYLLMALMWAFIYEVIDTLKPNAFSVTGEALEVSRHHFFYYSFVTITTVGYGDITPVSLVARSFSILEMLIGQIYLVVLIARLVGINISQSIDRRPR